jgi:ABC-type transport system substrate-binding protein
MRSTRAIEAGLVAAALLLAMPIGGCRSALDAPLPAAHPDDDTPRRGGTLRLASFGDVATLDPAQATDLLAASVVRLVYAGLVDFGPRGDVVPDLATRIEVEDEGRTYRFPLREGVHFQDGAELTADDVKRSVERALGPANPSPNASFYESIDGFTEFTEKGAPHLRGVVVEGRYVVAFHLREPDSRFLGVLAMTALRPLCPSVVAAPTFHPCGAGPFVVPEGGWQHGVEVRLARNDRYFVPGEPYLDGVSWALNMSTIVEGLKLSHGELDVVRDLTQAETVRYQSDPRWAPLGEYEPSGTVSGEAMNVEIPPFDNVEVRRAVASAIDRDRIVLLKASNLTAANKPVPADMPGYAPSVRGQTYDLQSARDHMKRAGFAFDPETGTGGWPAPIPYFVYRQGLPEMVAQVVQQDLAKIGLHLDLRVASFPTFSAITRRRGKSPMSPQSWQEDFPHPSVFLDQLFTRESISDDSSNNYSFYANDALDALLARARRTSDPAERTLLYGEAEQIVCDDAPWAFEYAYRSYQVRQAFVRGYHAHPVWAADVARVWIDRSATAERVASARLFEVLPR